MRTFTFVAAALVALTAAASPSFAQDASASEMQAAREMLEASRAHDNFVEGLALGMEQGGEDLSPAMRRVLQEFMDEHFRYEDFEPEFIRIYTELFTEEELRAFTEFYRSPAGQRMAALSAELQSATGRVANERLQAVMPQLMEVLIAAAEEEQQP